MEAVSEQLRRAILDAGVSRYRISHDTGIAESVLSRFVNRETGLDIGTVDKLAAYLGLQFVSIERKRRK
jgi:transcriptional regulator with XRE-family HTH domain